MNLEWLAANKFEEFGAWSGQGQKLRRDLTIGHVPGVYAFVADGVVVYLGKATHLRGRVRSYNRHLRVDPLRPHRGAHDGLADHSMKGIPVRVFVCRTATALEAADCEKAWIKEIDPEWNRTGRDLGHPPHQTRTAGV